MIGRRSVGGLGAALFLVFATLAAAQPPQQPPKAAPPPSDSATGSVFVRCDGSPDKHSGIELAARVVAIIATGGLAGPGEMPDASKRLTGADGVAACDAALAGEGDRDRRMELTLAKAVHEIEAKQFDTALADARSIPTLAGDSASDIAFQDSLMLSGLDLEAQALVRLGKPAEAEAVALKMAAAAPYDLLTQLRAAPFVGLTAPLTPEKRDFYDRYARLYPQALLGRADADDWAGDYAGAAKQTQSLIDVYAAFVSPDHPQPPQAALMGREAVELAMAGDAERSNALAAQARAGIQTLISSGVAATSGNVADHAAESLDFQAIVVQLAAGRAASARAAFAGRSQWLAVPPAIVADLAARLRDGAPADALTGALERDPASMRAEALASRAAAISQSQTASETLNGAIRWPLPLRAFDLWARDVWKTDKSPFLPKKTGRETYAGDLVAITQDVNLPYTLQPVPVGEALMMHCALLARAKGKTGFVLFPTRQRINVAIVRFGDPAELGVPASTMLSAQAVIDALSPQFPDPRAH